MALITAFVALALAHTGFAKSTPHAEHDAHSGGSSAEHHSQENKAGHSHADEVGPFPQGFPSMVEPQVDPEQLIIQDVKECINMNLQDIVQHCPESIKEKAWCGQTCQNAVNHTLTKLSDGVCCDIVKGTPFEAMIPACKTKVMPPLIDKLHESYSGQCSVTELMATPPVSLASLALVAGVSFVAGAGLTTAFVLLRRKAAQANEVPLLA